MFPAIVRSYRPAALCAGLLVALVPAPSGQAQSPNESPASIELEACRFAGLQALRSVRGECGELVVPLDYDDPDGATVTLSVARVAALKRKPRNVAITVIAGGPGQASLDFYAAYHPAFRRMREEFDIILVDQRGTGDSQRLSCSLPDQSLGGLWSAEETARLAAECVSELGVDPRFFTTSVAVRDLDAVRDALGYEQLAVYGISYGTRVAQHYLRRFEANTHSVILDGVVPVDEALGPDIPFVAQRALASAFTRCTEQDACLAAFGNLTNDFKTVIDAVRKQPVEVTLAHPITAQSTTLTVGHLDLAGAVRLLSYAPQTVALLPLMIHEAAQGNYVPLTAQALTVSASLADSMAYGMHNSVVCAEDVPFFKTVDDDALATTYLGREIVESLRAVCDVWPKGVIDDDFKTPFSSDVPVLVLSGENDPVTPPAYGARAAEYLGNARHLIGKGQGHGQAAIGCMPKLMGDFVRERAHDTLDAECFELQGPEPFFIDYAGPQP